MWRFNACTIVFDGEGSMSSSLVNGLVLIQGVLHDLLESSTGMKSMFWGMIVNYNIENLIDKSLGKHIKTGN